MGARAVRREEFGLGDATRHPKFVYRVVDWGVTMTIYGVVLAVPVVARALAWRRRRGSRSRDVATLGQRTA